MIPCWPDDAADIRTLAVDTLGAMGESLVSGRKATDAREMPVFNPIAACVPRGAPDGRARGDGLKWRADAERALLTDEQCVPRAKARRRGRTHRSPVHLLCTRLAAQP